MPTEWAWNHLVLEPWKVAGGGGIRCRVGDLRRRSALLGSSTRSRLWRSRGFGIVLGYENVNDHDELPHAPMMAILTGKLAAREVAGKSTLNQELSKLAPTRYHKISHNPMAIKTLLVDLFVGAHERAPRQIILDLDATDDPLHGEQEGRFSLRFTTFQIGLNHAQLAEIGE